jgi:hypothetical protein
MLGREFRSCLHNASCCGFAASVTQFPQNSFAAGSSCLRTPLSDIVIVLKFLVTEDANEGKRNQSKIREMVERVRVWGER